ncbi:PGF-CTERM sorting domain-containing protein [Halobacteriales archaeon QS_1_68_17]|nr:MAG: PGF-CTERM sorting domain-containing protein [Halobacteriales archaeon QS_1_68_17]
MRRLALAVCVLLAVAPALGVAGGQSSASGNPCAGTITAPANGTTVISVQGARFGEESGKTSARVVGVGPRGQVRWVDHSGQELGIVWSYDVDPLGNGNVFVTATRPGTTVFYELDPRTGRRLWTEQVPFTDTHDADKIDRHRILVANMRNYNETAGRNEDRILVYNRTTDSVVWEWRFADHYGRDVGGNYTEDWTHVNDVDALGDGRYLVSPRNFDQVIVVDRSTGEIDLRLGSHGNHRVMQKQHNPQYLAGEDGRPTILVADSENDRIVEYARENGGWERTWRLGDSDGFSWPRDADRLPNGNTLIADSRNNRVVEVTPAGEVVWEFYAPWLVYDVARIPHGDESGGPTIAEQGAEGAYELSGAADPDEATLESCARGLTSFDGWPGARGGSGGQSAIERTVTITLTPTAAGSPSGSRSPTATPAGGSSAGGPGFGVGAAVLSVLALLALLTLLALRPFGRARR